MYVSVGKDWKCLAEDHGGYQNLVAKTLHYLAKVNICNSCDYSICYSSSAVSTSSVLSITDVSHIPIVSMSLSILVIVLISSTILVIISLNCVFESIYMFTQVNILVGFAG